MSKAFYKLSNTSCKLSRASSKPFRVFSELFRIFSELSKTFYKLSRASCKLSDASCKLFSASCWMYNAFCKLSKASPSLKVLLANDDIHDCVQWDFQVKNHWAYSHILAICIFLTVILCLQNGLQTLEKVHRSVYQATQSDIFVLPADWCTYIE